MEAPTAWSLAWSDDFTGGAPDASKWDFLTGGNGFGNQEREFYTAGRNNTFLDGAGDLAIEARKDDAAQHQCWCGEIDTMENIGRQPNQVHGSLHGPNGYNTSSTFTLGEPFANAFHVFALYWFRDHISFEVDGKIYNTQQRRASGWAYDHPFHLVLNLAIGGRAGQPQRLDPVPVHNGRRLRARLHGKLAALPRRSGGRRGRATGGASRGISRATAWVFATRGDHVRQSRLQSNSRDSPQLIKTFANMLCRLAGPSKTRVMPVFMEPFRIKSVDEFAMAPTLPLARHLRFHTTRVDET